MQRRNGGYPSGRCWALGLYLVLALPGVAGARGWSADLGVTYDDNVTLAENKSDILSDTFISGGVSKSLLWRLANHHRVISRAFIEVYSYNEYDGLSHVAAGINVTYQYRASGKALEPTWGTFFRLWADEYDSEYRDSGRFSAGVNMRKAYTDRLTLVSALSGNWRESDGVVWDTSDVSLLLNLDYQLAKRATLYFTFDYREGDIVSTAQPSLKLAGAIYDGYVEASQPDDAFGGNARAYRLNGRTLVGKLGANFILNETNSIDVAAWYATADAKGDFSYDRTTLSIAYLTRF